MNRFALIERAGRRIVDQRLQSRAPLSAHEILDRCQVGGQNSQAALRILAEIDASLGISTYRLRPNDLLRDVFRVHKVEFGEEPAGWEDTDLGEYIEVFTYDLLAIVERLSTKRGWANKWKELSPLPSTEEEWIDTILSMTLCEFLTFFSEIIDSGSRGGQ